VGGGGGRGDPGRAGERLMNRAEGFMERAGGTRNFQLRGRGRIIGCCMPSFPDSIFLFVLALLLFGPKRLPVLARELGKWVGEFRRASNEFKMQMEDELRLSEQAERNKQIAAMEAAAPVTPAIAAETEAVAETQVSDARPGAPGFEVAETAVEAVETQGSVETQVSEARPGVSGFEVVDGVKTPLPIAVSGDLKIMPPSTGLPVASSAGARNGALAGLLDAIPAAETAADETAEAETTAHGN
jgi:sec-independent protein translocase protein TatB